MKITVTEEMREALRCHKHEKEHGTFGSRTVQALRVTRLVAEAVEREEPKVRRCNEDGCSIPARDDSTKCERHDAELIAERARYLAAATKEPRDE